MKTLFHGKIFSFYFQKIQNFHKKNLDIFKKSVDFLCMLCYNIYVVEGRPLKIESEVEENGKNKKILLQW